MSLFSKIVTGILGKKSDKDLKVLSPFVNKINDYYKTLSSLTDDQLKVKFSSISENFKNSEEDFKDSNKDNSDDEDYFKKLDQFQKDFLDSKMIEVFAIVKDAARRLVDSKFTVMGQETVWDMIHYDVQLIGGVVLHQGKIGLTFNS